MVMHDTILVHHIMVGPFQNHVNYCMSFDMTTSRDLDVLGSETHINYEDDHDAPILEVAKQSCIIK